MADAAQSATASADNVVSLHDFGDGAESIARRWITELDLAEKEMAPWQKRARNVLRRFRDERDTGANKDDSIKDVGNRYNILWSIYQTLFPLIYARMPNPEVERRWKDEDPLGRAASEILERATSFSIDEHFDICMRQACGDYLLPGRGVTRYVYDGLFEDVAEDPAGGSDKSQIEGPSVTDTAPNGSDPGEIDNNPASKSTSLNEAISNAMRGTPQGEGVTQGDTKPKTWQKLVYEQIKKVHVGYDNFLHNPAMVWADVRWVDFYAYMTRDQLVKRFGSKIGNQIPLDYKPPNTGAGDREDKPEHQMFQKAVIHEIWDKDSRKVIWISKAWPSTPLDQHDDPLKLREFFPCTRPLYATLTNDSLIPIPDYCMYQDQARELDNLTQRIQKLVEVIRIMGTHNAAMKSLARIFEEGAENQLIAEEAWSVFTESGGIKGNMDLVDLTPMVAALKQLYESREAVKDIIYEITGVADILRGESDPRETLGAQRIKGRFATVRLTDRQDAMARYVRDNVALVAEIIAENFAPETIALMAGVEYAQDPDIQQTFQQAVGLLRNDALRNFRVTIETDSTVALDDEENKQSAIQLTEMVGNFLTNAGPIVQAAPEFGDFIGELLKQNIRQFKGGRALESALDKAIEGAKQRQQQAQQNGGQAPDPKMIEAQASAQQKQAQAQAEGVKASAAQTVAGAQARHLDAKTADLQRLTGAKVQSLGAKTQLDAQDQQIYATLDQEAVSGKLMIQAAQVHANAATGLHRSLQQATIARNAKNAAPGNSRPKGLN